jgi:Na+/melibiose symporter-like transporter
MIVISAASAVVTPAWTSLVSDIIPRPVRGRFFSSRNILMSVGALLTVNLAGQIVTRGGFPNGYMASATVFWLLSWASLFFFTRVRDVPFSPTRTQSPRRMSIDTEALHNPRFSTWIKITVFFNFFVGLCGSLFGAYLIQDLGGTPAHLASMSFLGGLTGILGQRFWGPVSDRRGPKFAVVTSAFLCAAVPVLWYAAKTPWGAILAETFSGAAWSGWGLCSFNLILDMTPEGRRPSYVATANLIGGIPAFVAPLIGGYFAMKYSLRPMMLVSAVGRFATGYLLLRYIPNAREADRNEGGLSAPANS